MFKISFLSIFMGALAASNAQACDYCQREVTLSKKMADCYLSLYQDEINQMKENEMPAQLINLSSCENSAEVTRGSSALPSNFDDATLEQPITRSFLLDEPGLECLARELRKESWPAEDAPKTFEVKREC